MSGALRPVIFDIGLHHGEDTDFYLKKGFDVVAVEADPRHVTKAKERFAGAIAEGRMEIVSAAIADEPGEIEFYVNLDKDDWGSTDPTYGTRAGTRHEKIGVPAIRFDELFTRVSRQGLAGEGPRRVHYVKCDIEGGDIHVLTGLLRCPLESRPMHLSVEAHKVEYAAYLAVMGFTRFKLVNQNLNWTQKVPNPTREGEGSGREHFEYQFKGHSSGPFGEEAPGLWVSFEEVAYLYMSLKRAAASYPTISIAWYDFHAAMEVVGGV